MSKEKEIESLIQLLDDPDNEVFKAVKAKLNKIGPSVIPLLETAWENSLDELFQTRIEDITKDIHFTKIKDELAEWVETSPDDLLKGSLIIARYQYPELDEATITSTIDQLKKDIWLEINDQLTALEKTKILNHIIYEVHGYSRSTKFMSSVQSNHLNHLIQTKKGSPLALAILYMVLAQNLDLPIYGVALPKNFILCYKNIFKSPFEDEQFNDEVLFYINPFNKGYVFGRKEIDLFIKQQKLEQKKTYFKPCSNKETLIELINNLIVFYKKNGDETKVEDYSELLKILYF